MVFFQLESPSVSEGATPPTIILSGIKTKPNIKVRVLPLLEIDGNPVKSPLTDELVELNNRK